MILFELWTQLLLIEVRSITSGYFRYFSKAHFMFSKAIVYYSKIKKNQMKSHNLVKGIELKCAKLGIY